MFSVGNTSVGSGASLSLDARAAAGTAVLAANATSSRLAVSTPDTAVSVPTVPNYLAFEFIYRSDYGKIVLREQNVETGQQITQVPNEYQLKQYAATQRAERVQQQGALFHQEDGAAQPGTGTKAAGSTTGKTATTTSTAQSAPAPVAEPVVVAAATAHVDIKV